MSLSKAHGHSRFGIGSIDHCPTGKSWYHAFMKRGDPVKSERATSPEENLQVTVPHVTKKSLKIRAAESGDPMRVIVLRALAAAGIQVPNEELQDRRKIR